MTSRNPKWLSLAALARRLDLPQTRATALLKKGLLTPDSTLSTTAMGKTHKTYLFDESRIPRLMEQLGGAGQRSIRS